MARHKGLNRSSGGGIIGKFFLTLSTLAVIAGLAAAFFLFEMEKPSIRLGQEIHVLGGKAEFSFEVADGKSGLRAVEVVLQQGDKAVPLLTKDFPRSSWIDGGPKKESAKVSFNTKQAGLKEGAAELILTVRDQSLMGFFRGNRTVTTIPVTIDTTAPVVAIKNARRYIRPGGSAVVVYTVSEEPSRHGVMLGTTFFPGFPSTKKGEYLAYFALPWNAKSADAAKVIALDKAGNEAQAGFTIIFKPVQERHDTINLSDSFFEQKLPEFRQHYPELKGDSLTQFLYVNNDIRRENAKKITELCTHPEMAQLWHDRFERMPGAGRAQYADQRTYVYQGKAVDEETHLGVDIASLAQSEVRAANKGKVIFAEYLGIYGNTIILDHGQGLYSPYCHLSSIGVTPGSIAEKGQPMGKTGSTGMAGGDHLHLSMLVHGIFVTPVEWWDQHWIDVNIKAALNE